jgi:2-dehydropantoate 2-reductase
MFLTRMQMSTTIICLQRLLPPTAGHCISMLQNIIKGRKTEIDALNGAISQYARESGISTPYNDLLTALIKFKEKPENQGQGRTRI